MVRIVRRGKPKLAVAAFALCMTRQHRPLMTAPTPDNRGYRDGGGGAAGEGGGDGAATGFSRVAWRVFDLRRGGCAAVAGSPSIASCCPSKVVVAQLWRLAAIVAHIPAARAASLSGPATRRSSTPAVPLRSFNLITGRKSLKIDG